jgi:alkaline phosphatase
MTQRSTTILISAGVLVLVVAAGLVSVVFLTGGAGAQTGQQTQNPPASFTLGTGPAHAKNVILMIGDGMGSAELTAARWERADGNPAAYSPTSLAMDRLDYSGRVTTLAADAPVTDSAAAISAIMTGVKTNRGVIGLDATTVKGASDGARVQNIAEMAMARGCATGVITTSRITDATPAGTYAHVNDRDDEILIADQLLSSGIDVALGGGYRSFIDSASEDPWGKEGRRTDGQDLVAVARSRGYTVVTSADELGAAPVAPGTRVLGLFDTSTMEYESGRDDTKQPGLSGMTEKAVDLLATDPDGFFLLVEGGLIDHAASDRDYEDAVGETLAFDDAVKTALDFADAHPDTLVIVTADHETGGLILQGSGRGVDGIFASGSRMDKNETGLTFGDSASHTAVDVPIMASGPGADRVGHGTIDNTQVFGIMRDAMGL